MKKVLLLGAGKIGSLIACLLEQSHDYFIYWGDISFIGNDYQAIKDRLRHVECVNIDVQDPTQLAKFLKQHPVTAIISSLPYFCNVAVAQHAKNFNTHYFDLTEDRQVTAVISQLAVGSKQAFVPQCGLAPGFIEIVSESLINHFDELEDVNLRVGALPAQTNNGLHYSLTWSTEGLINEYGNMCEAIENSKLLSLLPLEGLETVHIEGEVYEAFNTSGGLGNLAVRYAGKVRQLNYKTLRYPGHCEKIRFLMNDLRLNQDRKTLKHIFERAIPKTYQDVVLIYVSVSGQQGGHFIEENYVKKVYPQIIAGQAWSAIQLSTAASLCSVVDLVLTAPPEQYQGIVYQEQFKLATVSANRFGHYFIA